MRLSSDASGWLALKQQGRRCYESGDYREALEAYQSALESAHPQEKQLILSNIVACRLKLLNSSGSNGSEEEERAALLRDAQECVRLNESWAKGHVRLAEAYIALGGHSNEACNSLQTALRLDPGHAAARQMLVRELRRDHRASSSSLSSRSSSSMNNESFSEEPSSRSSSGPEAQDQEALRRSATSPAAATAADLDDYESLSWSDCFWYYYGQVLQWYSRLSDTSKSLLRIMGVLIVLYVAFGGRFGLEYVFSGTSGSGGSSSSHSQGNYGQGNVYDQYRRRQQEQQSQHHQSYHGGGGGYHHGHRDPYSGGGGYGTGAGGGSWYGSSSSFMDPTTLMLILGGALLAHQAGMNPMHALLLVTRFGRRRHMMGGFGGGGGGGGFGYGGHRRQQHYRPRGGWHY